jgi:hypothetical protein
VSVAGSAALSIFRGFCFVPHVGGEFTIRARCTKVASTEKFSPGRVRAYEKYRVCVA